MTNAPTPETPSEIGHDETELESGATMPRWIPLLIGAILVVMAALAVYTGLRYRDSDTLTSSVGERREDRMTSAPPGEPGAGASLVMHGDEGQDSTPAAKPPVQGEARAVITGGPGGVETQVRIWARRGMLLQITPPESMVYVNDMPIGQASQFDTKDEIYEFAAPGSYTVKVVAPSNAQKTYVVTAAEDAREDVAQIKATL